jgi:hypothetical protein
VNATLGQAHKGQHYCSVKHATHFGESSVYSGRNLLKFLVFIDFTSSKARECELPDRCYVLPYTRVAPSDLKNVTPIHLHSRYKLLIYRGGCQTTPVFTIFWTPILGRHLSHDGAFCLSKAFPNYSVSTSKNKWQLRTCCQPLGLIMSPQGCELRTLRTACYDIIRNALKLERLFHIA